MDEVDSRPGEINQGGLIDHGDVIWEGRMEVQLPHRSQLVDNGNEDANPVLRRDVPAQCLGKALDEERAARSGSGHGGKRRREGERCATDDETRHEGSAARAEMTRRTRVRKGGDE